MNKSFKYDAPFLQLALNVTKKYSSDRIGRYGIVESQNFGLPFPLALKNTRFDRSRSKVQARAPGRQKFRRFCLRGVIRRAEGDRTNWREKERERKELAALKGESGSNRRWSTDRQMQFPRETLNSAKFRRSDRNDAAIFPGCAADRCRLSNGERTPREGGGGGGESPGKLAATYVSTYIMCTLEKLNGAIDSADHVAPFPPLETENRIRNRPRGKNIAWNWPVDPPSDWATGFCDIFDELFPFLLFFFFWDSRPIV